MTKRGDAVETLTFTVALPPRVLRRNTATVERENPKPGQSRRRAVHWSDRAKAKRQYQEAVWIAGNAAFVEHATYGIPSRVRLGYAWPSVLGMPWERAHVHYVWCSTHETDIDNIIASMKPALDVCKATGPRPLGIIADDGPGVTVTAEWQKASKRDECVVVRIERVQ